MEIDKDIFYYIRDKNNFDLINTIFVNVVMQYYDSSGVSDTDKEAIVIIQYLLSNYKKQLRSNRMGVEEFLDMLYSSLKGGVVHCKENFEASLGLYYKMMNYYTIFVFLKSGYIENRIK